MTEDIKLEVIKKTQETLGKFIKKPVLSEKLLKKPPFRFLHDLTMSIIRDTGFLTGLYSETESQSENIKDRDMKIAFLQKLIEAVKIVTGTNISARPSKIIAGLEPTRTNQLLQMIASALEKKLDSSDAVAQVTGGATEKQKNHTKEESNTRTIQSKEKLDDKRKHKRSDSVNRVSKKNEEKAPVQKIRQSPRTEKENKKNSASSSQDKSKKEKIASARIKNSTESPKDTPMEIETKPKITEEDTIPTNIEETTANNTTEKIIEEKTEITSISESVIEKPVEESQTVLNSTIQPVQQEPELMISKQPLKKEGVIRRPTTSLRPPSVRPSSARPGAPRLKERNDTILPPDELITMGKVNVIIESVDGNKNEQDDEETLVMETEPEIPAWPQETVTENIPAEKGHLVSQILDQIADQSNSPAPRVQIRWDQSGDASREAASVKLRQSIQTLTRAANPLGKLMNFLQEDVDSMISELNMWIVVNEKLTSEIKTQKRLNEDSMRPLQDQLVRTETDIAKQQEMISITQANILKNQNKIKSLLTRD